MAFTLRVFFSGLCAFIPERPFSDGPSPGPGAVRVLLPDLIKPLPLSPRPGTNGQLILDPHYPILEFNRSQLRAGSRQADFLSQMPALQSKGYCLLLEESLSLGLDQASPVTDGIETPPYDEKVADSLFFLSDLAKISPLGHNLRPGLFNGPPKRDADNPGVIAAIELQQGRLSVARKTPEVQTLSAPSSNTAFQQQIATHLMLEILNVEGQVVVSTNAAGKGDLILAPDPDNPLDDAVEIQIQNREIDDFIGIPQDQPQYLSRGALFDFESFYDTLIQGPTGASGTAAATAPPVPISQKAFASMATVPRGTSCPPVTAPISG